MSILQMRMHKDFSILLVGRMVELLHSLVSEHRSLEDSARRFCFSLARLRQKDLDIRQIDCKHSQESWSDRSVHYGWDKYLRPRC